MNNKEVERVQARAFPELESLVRTFCERNGLSKPTRLLPVTDGLILGWDPREDLALLHIKREREEYWDKPHLQPTWEQRELVGLWTERRATYYLEGLIQGAKVGLRTVVSFRETYKSGSNDSAFMLGLPAHTRGKPSIQRTRIDKEDYWFMED